MTSAPMLSSDAQSFASRAVARVRAIPASMARAALPIDRVDLIVLALAAVLAGGVVAGAAAGHDAATVARGGGTAPVDAVLAAQPMVDVLTAEAGGATWAGNLGTSLHASVRVLPGTGYVDGAMSFEQVAAQVDPSAAVVVVITPRSGGSAAITLASRVTATVAALHKRGPDASVLLVGPIVAPGASDAVRGVSSVVHSAAMVTGAHWVDPKAGAWVTARQVGAKGRLTAAGSAAVARHLAAQVSPLLR